MVVYERHLVDFDPQVKVLEKRREDFLLRVEPIGVYTALDVPDRVGPTWSRRSGT